MKRCSLTVLMAGLLLGASIAQDAPQSDRDRIQGTWVCLTVVNDGDDLRAEAIQITFVGDKMTVLWAKDKKEEATFTLSPGKKPKEITMREGIKERKGIYDFRIFALSGEVLKVCVGAPGQERPKAFDVRKGSNLTLLVLKREER